MDYNPILFRSVGAHLSHKDGFVLVAFTFAPTPDLWWTMAKGYYLKRSIISFTPNF